MHRRIKYAYIRQRKLCEQLGVNVRQLNLIGTEFGLSQLEKNKLLEFVGSPGFNDGDNLDKLHFLMGFAERDLGMEREQEQEKFAKAVMEVLFPSLALPF